MDKVQRLHDFNFHVLFADIPF